MPRSPPVFRPLPSPLAPCRQLFRSARDSFARRRFKHVGDGLEQRCWRSTGGPAVRGDGATRPCRPFETLRVCCGGVPAAEIH